MSSQPAISVLMPVYNAERYVAAAVESILGQTFGDFEFLITDDGSSDRSLQILKRYAAKDDRIRLTSQPNAGLVKTLNQMLLNARSELIARMDADDISLPDRLAHQIEFLRLHPEVVCVGGAQDYIDEAGRVLNHMLLGEQDDEVQRFALAGMTPINHPSAMFRRDAVLQVGGYDESFYPSEDLDLWLRLGEIGKLANLPETVLKYRQHMHSISERQQQEQTYQKQRACEAAWQRRGIAGRFEATDPWRPVDAASRHQFMLRYGWNFFNAGQRQAAIVYGLRSIQALPFHQDGWRLLACALIKPLPQANSR